MFLYERLEKIIKECQELEEKFLEAEEGSDEEESIGYILNDLENYIGKIEDILNNEKNRFNEVD